VTIGFQLISAEQTRWCNGVLRLVRYDKVRTDGSLHD